MNNTRNNCWGVVLLFFLCGSMEMLCAAEGEPMAIRRWPGGTISLETHWGHCLAVHPTANQKSQMASQPDQELATDALVDHVLTRLPNEEDAAWLPSSEAPQDDNAVHVKSIIGADGLSNGIELKVDGVKIVILSEKVTADRSIPTLGQVDLLVVTLGDNPVAGDWGPIMKSVQPRFVVLNSHNTLDDEFLQKFKTSVKAADEVLLVGHNTMALAKSSTESTALRLVKLTTIEWEMPEELAQLFAAMEKASADSQAVFAKLSTNQMNFKPSNGTHTPRWNTEHMMGRQLGFFSQIYHTKDATLPAIDLNPKQMPPDYEFAHPNWSGQEEARQMERVSQFTRRFAYLLSDLDLDKQAPGSRWPSLRALLKQMQRHYSEHTANTIKKFDLPNWPNE